MDTGILAILLEYFSYFHTTHKKHRIIAMKFLPAILVFLLVACTHQTSKPNKDKNYYKILFQEQMVGRLTLETSYQQDQVITREKLELKTSFRGMKAITSQIVETHIETPNGEAVGYLRQHQTPNAEREYSGSIKNGYWYWQKKQASATENLTIKAPSDFLLHQGLSNKMKPLLRINQNFSYHAWNDKTRQFEKVNLQVISYNEKDISWKILQTYPNLPRKKSKEYWVDKNFKLLTSQFTYKNFSLSLTNCTGNCETQTLTPIRPLDHQMLASPYRITEASLQGHIRYQLKVTDDISIPSTSEQKAKKQPNGSWQLDVCANCAPLPDQDPNSLQNYLTNNSWLNTTDLKLISAVNRKIKPGMTEDEKMQTLTQLTRSRLSGDLQFQGYANASQAYQSRKGDCTEYALLLASFGRIAGIPTRVVMGLSYSREYFHGKRDMYAPHAWVQAWVNGSWKSYDAGLEAFDAGHLALKISQGDQSDFSEMIKSLEGISILSSQHVVKRSTH